MGLIKTAAKVAVASSVHGRVQRRQQQRWAAQDSLAPAQASPVASAPPPPSHHAPVGPAPSPADELQRQVDLLRQLGELRDSGIIDDAEFEAKKAKILG